MSRVGESTAASSNMLVSLPWREKWGLENASGGDHKARRLSLGSEITRFAVPSLAFSSAAFDGPSYVPIRPPYIPGLPFFALLPADLSVVRYMSYAGGTGTTQQLEALDTRPNF